jgi:hypothetical protein
MQADLSVGGRFRLRVAGESDEEVTMTNVIPMNADGPLLMISENKVTLEELQRVLASIFIECEREHDRLHVVDGLDDPCFVSIDHERTFVLFISNIEHKGPKALVIEKTNELNGDLIMVRFRCDDDRDTVWAEYFMTYDGGLNVRQFVKLLRRFAKIVNTVEIDVFGAPL